MRKIIFHKSTVQFTDSSGTQIVPKDHPQLQDRINNFIKQYFEPDLMFDLERVDEPFYPNIEKGE